ncbi:hypothetical protein [Oryzobacter terrae]|uniref:hypothetical protein n=1 Tax=Oryzobacter terrae TaxID=1620385 RepID=UPI00366E4B3C
MDSGAHGGERDARRLARHRMTWSTAGAVTCLAMALLMVWLLDRAGDPMVVAHGTHALVAVVGALGCLVTLRADRLVAQPRRGRRRTPRAGRVGATMLLAWLAAVLAVAVGTGFDLASVAMVTASAPMVWIPTVLARTAREESHAG